MKKNLLFALAIVLALAACQKDAKYQETNADQQLKSITLEEAIRLNSKSLNISNPVVKNVQVQSNTASAQNFGICPAIPTLKFTTGFNISIPGNDNYEGAGHIVEYKFKKGRNYTIKFNHYLSNNYSEESEKITNFPSLQIGLANQNSIPMVCQNYIDLNTLPIPSANVPVIPGENKYTGHANDHQLTGHPQTISLNADECYDFLWFNGLPVPGTNRTFIGIHQLTITETGGNFILQQAGSLDNSGLATFSVVYNSLAIDHEFEWETTGNLVIEGSNFGKTVSVRSTGGSFINGKVMALIPGCGIFAELNFDNCTGISKKVINGGCETGIRTCSHSEDTGAFNQMGPLYDTHWNYVFSDGTTNPAGITRSNHICNN